MKIYLLVLAFLVGVTAGHSQTGVIENFDDNVLSSNWATNVLGDCPSCYTLTETNSELRVANGGVGPNYENFEFRFPTPLNLLANPIVKISVKNSTSFSLRLDLTDVNGNATNQSPNVTSITVNSSFTEYVFDFTGKFNQSTPTAAPVDASQIAKVVFFVNPGGSSFASTFYFNNLIVGTPPAPTAGFTANFSTVCIGNPVTFTNTSSNATSYSWSFSPGTNTAYGPHMITWSSAGTKTVSITATGPDGSNDTYSTPITVTGIPSAAGPITGSASACSGTSGVYSIAAVSGASGYTWSLPSGATITSGLNTNTVTILFGNSGGTISVTPISNCGSGAASSLPVTINPSSPASVSISTTTPSICSGASVLFTATPANGGTPVYQWKVNGLNVGTNSSTYTSTTLSDNDVVTVVMTSSAPCAAGSPATSNSIVMNVGTSTSPTVSITSVDPLNICAGSNITIAAHPLNVDGDTVLVWKRNGIVISGESNDTLIVGIVNDNDVFMCEMTYSGCANGTVNSNTLTFDVTPRVQANVFIEVDNDSVCLNSPVTFKTITVRGGLNPSFQWKVNNIDQGINNSEFTIANLADKDTVTVIMTSNSGEMCLINNPAMATIGMRVFSTMASEVKISASSTSTCSGNPITFTATPIKNGGDTPAFQWKVGGVNQGTNSPTFSYNPANNDVVTCVMTSSISCAQPSTSNSIQVTVTSSLSPSVEITTLSTTVCAGSQVKFTAEPTNGGDNPTYSWEINGVDQSAVLSTFTTTVNDGDEITVTMTSDLSCAATPTATSDPLVMTVKPLVTPSVSIGANPPTSICKGSPVTFTATPTEGGLTPSYLWKLNGSSTGVTSETYTTSDLYDNDVVICEMISNVECASTSSAVISNAQTMTVNAVAPVSISIDAGGGSTTICEGTAVNFTASYTNEGDAPIYEWKLNNTPVGSNSPSFSHTGLSANDEITCTLTSNETCATGSPATSNKIEVIPAVNPTIEIEASQNPVCSGSGIIFTISNETGRGTSPSYKWKNGSAYIPGEISSTYNATTVNEGDVIVCELTSNASCAPSTPIPSNAITVSIITPPAISVNIATLSNSICSGQEVTFTAAPSDQTATHSFQWYVNGQLSGDNSDTYTADNLANNQIVHCAMTTSTACGLISNNSNSLTMTVSDPPSTATAGQDQYITSTDFFMEADAPGTGMGTWTTTGSAIIQSPNSPNTLVQNLSMGANTFTWTVTNGNCQANSDAVIINVGTAPTAQTITGPLNVAEGATGVTYSVPDNGGNFFWSVTGAVIASPDNATSITVDFLTTDATISVTEVTPFGNYTTSIPIDVGDPSSVFSTKASMAYSLFPNPFTEEATLIFHSSTSSPLTVIMVNMNGEKVFESNVFKTNERIIIGKDLPAGLYAIQAVSEKGTQVIKINKE